MSLSRTLICAIVLLPCASNATEPTSLAFKDQLTFEYSDSEEGLPGWGLTPGTFATLDRDVVYAGTASARIEHQSSSSAEFSSIMDVIDEQYVGERIELRGVLRTSDVQGWSGFWMGLSRGQESLEYANMAPEELNGSNDWQAFSIELPLNAQANQIKFGVILFGAGTIWADDLELLIDGVPIWDAQKAQGPLDVDTEFDSGSGIDIESPSQHQVEKLALLGRVWGFLKYHHRAVTGGQHHWDYELFRVMGPYLQATSSEDSRQVLLNWIDRLGPVPDCEDCAPEPQLTHLLPRLDWLEDDDLLGSDLSERLVAIHRNRSNRPDQFFVRPFGGVGNPIFDNEPDYAESELPDDGFRQLAVFRFWNVIENWFPYRNLIDAEWNAVLPDFIRRMAEVETAEDYHRVLMQMAAAVSDSHAQWNVTRSLPPVGECRLPYGLRFVDGEFVVWADGRKDRTATAKLRLGDVIHAIDGRSLADMVAKFGQYYSGSNQAAQHRQMSAGFVRGACEDAEIVVQRGQQRLAASEARVDRDEIDYSRLYQHVRDGDAYQALTTDVAYLKLPGIESSRIPEYLEELEDKQALIIDIRGYPSDFVTYRLGNHLAKRAVPFARFTQPDMKNPGAFSWTTTVSLKPQAPHYDGRVVVLVDEWTQSQAEFTAMAYRAAGARIVGSTTSGADGNYSSLTMPGGVSGGISGIGVFYPDQRHTQRVGIVPDIAATPTVTGIREGRDEVLEVALRTLVGHELDEQAIRSIALRPRFDSVAVPADNTSSE